MAGRTVLRPSSTPRVAGITTQHPWLIRGLDPTLKATRLAHYVVALRKECLLGDHRAQGQLSDDDEIEERKDGDDEPASIAARSGTRLKLSSRAVGRGSLPHRGVVARCDQARLVKGE